MLRARVWNRFEFTMEDKHLLLYLNRQSELEWMLVRGGPSSLYLASSRHTSNRLWLHPELKVIWETEVEDLNLLHASLLLSLLKSRNKLSCSNTAFSNTSPYFIVNSKCSLKINFLFLTLSVSLSFSPKPSSSH